jgi:hypothetical protein
MHKDGITYDNAVVKACKPIYMPKLNSRYIKDAVQKAKELNEEHVIFGSKANWNKLISKTITKKDWQNIRNNELFSRGDRSVSGNTNIRIIKTPEGYKLRISKPGNRKFIFFTAYIPEKLQEQFNLSSDCYYVLIKQKLNKFYIHIGLNIPETPIIYRCSSGIIGVDTNPDGLAITEIDSEGNLLNHEYLKCDRLPYAKHNKRKNDIEHLALQIVNKAILSNKGIALEDLKFNDSDCSPD